MTKEEVLNQILKLSDESKTATEIGAIVGLTKNAVMGRLYRHKTKNGYVPAPTSRYAFIRKYRKHKSNLIVIGTSKCIICSNSIPLQRYLFGRFNCSRLSTKPQIKIIKIQITCCKKII